jgi:crotonobetainyl-CoA:carnitine CoA-transferase CaiB-like acyl-CoA transferase
VKSKDGWVFIMCQNPKFWDLLVDGLDRDDLREDPRFSDLASRLENRAALTEVLDDVFSEKTAESWVDKFKGIIPISPVYDMAQALDNPFVEELNMITEVDHPDRPGMRVLNNPIRLNGERVPIKRAPKLGADTDEILKNIGYADSDISAMRNEGAI